MRTFFISLFAAIIGGLVVYGAFDLAPQLTSDSPRVIEAENPGNLSGTKNSPKGRLSAEQIYDRYGDAVVHVRAVVTSTYQDFFGLPQPENQVSSGSGFIVSDKGYVITNAHVVSGADRISIQFADSAEVSAKLIGIDQSTDIAVLKADLSNHKTGVLTLGDSKSVKVGEVVYAIGNPLGYDRSMSSGIISALNRELRAPNNFPIRGVIQTDAAINRGNSGGPLISSFGKVLGVTSQIATTGEGNIGIAFAIPSSTVKKVFSEIIDTGKASHAWVGIQGSNLLPKVAKKLKLKVDSGAQVMSVLDPGPAEKAGLRGANDQIEVDGETYDVGGDIIIKIEGRKIDSMDRLITELSQYRADETIEVEILRDNKFKVLEIELEERPQRLDDRPRLIR